MTKSNLALRSAVESDGDPGDQSGVFPVRATIADVSQSGDWVVVSAAGEWVCDVLEAAPGSQSMAVGDRVLVLPPQDGENAVVLGRIRRQKSAPTLQLDLVIESTRTLTLKCGASSIDLRADGKVMIRGEDVLVRATGTQRIRAGTVSIN